MARKKKVAEDGTEQESTGYVYVQHPDKKVKTLSWDGETYEVDGDGLFVVPEASLTDLLSHGFTHLPE